MAKLTRKSLEKFPGVIFIAIKSEDGSDPWFQASADSEDCMEDDGPEVVAHYKLTGLFKLRKTVRTIESFPVSRIGK